MILISGSPAKKNKKNKKHTKNTKNKPKI